MADEALTVWGEERREEDKNFNYIVLEPGILSDEPAKGRVQLGKPGKGWVSREDAARTAPELLDKGANGRFDLLESEEIKEAVERVVRGGVSAVEGESVEEMKEIARRFRAAGDMFSDRGNRA